MEDMKIEKLSGSFSISSLRAFSPSLRVETSSDIIDIDTVKDARMNTKVASYGNFHTRAGRVNVKVFVESKDIWKHLFNHMCDIIEKSLFLVI